VQAENFTPGAISITFVRGIESDLFDFGRVERLDRRIL
jgi:hypothetical protein